MKGKHVFLLKEFEVNRIILDIPFSFHYYFFTWTKYFRLEMTQKDFKITSNNYWILFRTFFSNSLIIGIQKHIIIIIY